MKRIEVIVRDNYIRVQNGTYLDSVVCVGDSSMLPNIGVGYDYLQWGTDAWMEKYYIDLNNHVQSFTAKQLAVLDTLVTNWVQPLGQEGNPTLKQAKDLKQSELTKAFNANVKTLTLAQDHEMASWKKQEDEARAYLVDNTVATPFIDNLLIARNLGETKDALIVKILAHVDAYALAYSSLLGKSQNLTVQVSAATTKAKVKAIVW